MKEASSFLSPPVFRLLIVMAFASALLRLFPWRLDYNDLAKQAYASYDMVISGAWWVQESPDGEVATKPPGVAWCSAGIYLLFRNWLLAWHLPSLLAAITVLILLWKWLGSGTAAGLAGLIFLWNHFSQDMIFVIRTDMVLAFFVLYSIGMIYEHIHSQRLWTLKESLLFALVLMAGLFSKGPVILAFLFPGIILYRIFYRRVPGTSRFFPPFWIWVLALGVFLAWVGVASVLEERFYNQVVLREFASRFQSGGVTRARPPGRYVLYFLQQFFPWSFFFLTLVLVPRFRKHFWDQPADRWLFLCCLGSWILLELLPSKRPDRMYPLIPLCAWLIGLAYAKKDLLPSARIFRPPVIRSFLVIAVVGQIAYSMATTYEDTQNQEGELVRFGHVVNLKASETGQVLWIQRDVAFQTGMVLYAESPHIATEENMIPDWRSATIRHLIVDEMGLKMFYEAGIQPGVKLVSENPDSEDERIHYYLVQEENSVKIPDNPQELP